MVSLVMEAEILVIDQSWIGLHTGLRTYSDLTATMTRSLTTHVTTSLLGMERPPRMLRLALPFNSHSKHSAVLATCHALCCYKPAWPHGQSTGNPLALPSKWTQKSVIPHRFTAVTHPLSLSPSSQTPRILQQRPTRSISLAPRRPPTPCGLFSVCEPGNSSASRSTHSRSQVCTMICT